jgi:hypothetical protein
VVDTQIVQEEEGLNNRRSSEEKQGYSSSGGLSVAQDCSGSSSRRSVEDARSGETLLVKKRSTNLEEKG